MKMVGGTRAVLDALIDRFHDTHWRFPTKLVLDHDSIEELQREIAFQMGIVPSPSLIQFYTGIPIETWSPPAGFKSLRTIKVVRDEKTMSYQFIGAM
ncbi:MAG: hypothetical protein Q7O66_07330 [Dehalococcoidia bacterium]|nr:hypothetical protein [Dehalococcoidia bacterium]